MASKHRNVSPYQTPRRGLSRGYKRKVSDYQKPTQVKRNKQIHSTRITDYSFQNHHRPIDLKGNIGLNLQTPWSNYSNTEAVNGNTGLGHPTPWLNSGDLHSNGYKNNDYQYSKNIEQNIPTIRSVVPPNHSYSTQHSLYPSGLSSSHSEENRAPRGWPNWSKKQSQTRPLDSTAPMNDSFQLNEEANKLLLSLDPHLINLIASHKTTVPAPDLMDKSSLKIRRQNIIDALFNKEDKQCSNCGLRFSKDDKASFDEHLDWHYREKSELNKTLREKQSRRRVWYPKFATIKSSKEENVMNNNVKEKEKVEEDNPAMIPIDNILLAVNNDIIKCNLCNEEFEQIYIHDQDLLYKSNSKYANLAEGWYLKNATWSTSSEVIHPTCSNLGLQH